MNYNETHAVVLTFKQLAVRPDDMAMQAHADYYRSLGGNASTLYYGDVMNEKAVCAIVSISSDLVFEQILEDDPALISGFYEITQVTPIMIQNQQIDAKKLRMRN